MYKSHHPDDTDDPDVVGVSSEDEAEGMSRRLNKPPPAGPSPPEPPALEEEGMIKFQRRT